MPGPADSYIAYGRDWANVSNTPFREYKHWVHEGGISTPLIVHWPAGIPAARRGKLETQPGHIIDLMATCVELAGAAYPREWQGQPIKPMEGISLVPAFEGKPLKRPEPLFWEHESNRAVREGRWKLVAKADQPWELYDMEKDRTEMHDLAGQHPEEVQRARRQMGCLGRARQRPAARRLERGQVEVTLRRGGRQTPGIPPRSTATSVGPPPPGSPAFASFCMTLASRQDRCARSA